MLGLVLAAQPDTAAGLIDLVGSSAALLRLPPHWEAQRWAQEQVGRLWALGGALNVSTDALDAVGSAAEGGGGEGGWGLGAAWGGVVGCLMVYFLLSTVQEVARRR